MTALRPQARDRAAPDGIALGAPAHAPSSATATLVGGAWGALVFGGAVSLVHVIHNRIDGLRDALAIWVFFALLGGLAAAGATALGTILHRSIVIARDASKGASRPTAAGLAGDLAWGLSLFHLAFFLPFALYGLTYDQVSFAGPPRTAAGMIAVLAAIALAIAAIAVLGSRAIARGLSALAAHGSLRRTSTVAAGAIVVAHVATALGFAALPGEPAVAASSLRPLRTEQRAHNRVVLIGLDGADWRVLRPLVERGEAPTFARLMREGASGPLTTLPDYNSPTIWASIYTGKRPGQHGVLDFYRTRLPGMSGPGIFPVHRTFFVQAGDLLASRGLLQRRIADRSFLRTRPIWEILDDLGASVGVVDGYQFSVPARPLHTAGGFFFSYALNALSQRPGFDPTALAAAERDVLFQPPDAMRWYAPHTALADFDWQAATLLDSIAASGQPDFVNLYTHQPDLVEHQRWKWFEPERFVDVDPADLERWHDAIPATYRAFDRFLGELLPRLEPGTTLMVVSDHGHSPTLIHSMYSQHRHGPPGIVLLWGDSVRRGVELEGAHVYDIAPTILRLLGLPAASDFAGRSLDDALDPAALGAAARPIASYDAFGAARFEGSVGPDLSPEEIERLRALGYL